MSSIAIIPARGGSKRIPRKNIKNFLGKPIIGYAIEAAINSKLFDRIIVSTEDQEIANIAKSFGAEVPFLRSTENSSDFATTAAVIEEVIDQLETNKQIFDIICCIYPTAPFVTASTLINSFAKFKEFDGDSLFPVCKFGVPPQRALVRKLNTVTMQNPQHENTRSQDLEPLYHDAGQFYWVKSRSFMTEKTLYTKNSVFYEVDELLTQDIDNPVDWQLAELKYTLSYAPKD